ncbi:hypothetical protein AAFC00_006872 [Neodothiora populina]|uniref:Hcy-binding domain-containing protein n=1 Tax=Neodothiora populina TaxID=2781224 RepID=A0ABR3PBG0_9PEZI
MSASMSNAILETLADKPVIVLDGALATELEARGLDLSSSLWSAKALQQSPELIYSVHLDYFRSGADVAITASYQATPLGLEKHLGMSVEDSIQLIRKSVELAQQARDATLEEERVQNPGMQARKMFVAGSVGPYGAYLADGSEYRGDYSISDQEMKAFHRPRIQALADAGVDVLACETIPSFAEVKALLDLLQTEFPQLSAWLSYTVRDPTHLSDGTPLADVTAATNKVDQIIAVGVNCIPERDVSSVLKHLSMHTTKPLIAYPNSGEQWNAEARSWSGQRAQDNERAHDLKEWFNSGARLIGGCCRTGPEDIKVICKHVQTIDQA